MISYTELCMFLSMCSVLFSWEMISYTEFCKFLSICSVFQDFIFQQTMFRIKDPKPSLDFYTRILGMRLLKKLDFPSMKFSLYFMGFEDAKDIPQDENERTAWCFSRKATLELTQLVSLVMFGCKDISSTLHIFVSMCHGFWFEVFTVVYKRKIFLLRYF